jgi:gamma-glutamylcyclotransferase (GGCT)/AIG2-like uncharacterized protein YtfP
MENLFSYGTLQLKKVQLETFGRSLQGVVDILIGYKKEMMKIKVDSVAILGVAEEHVVISYTGKNSDRIEGIVFSITPEELVQADNYETNAYKRVKLFLQSGESAWVYVTNEN